MRTLGTLTLINCTRLLILEVSFFRALLKSRIIDYSENLMRENNAKISEITVCLMCDIGSFVMYLSTLHKSKQVKQILLC